MMAPNLSRRKESDQRLIPAASWPGGDGRPHQKLGILAISAARSL